MKKNILTFLFFTFFGGVILFTPSDSANAAKAELLGKFKNWQAVVYKNGKKKICYMNSRPTKQTGKYKHRGDAWMFIVLKENVSNHGEISYKAGYRYKPKCDLSRDKNCQVKAKIGTQLFEWYTDKDMALAYQDDPLKIIQAMRKGNKLVITGYSQRGTKTVDTISLLGFTKAYAAIKKACK